VAILGNDPEGMTFVMPSSFEKHLMKRPATLFIIALICALPVTSPAVSAQAHQTDHPGLVILRGQVVCLDARGRKLDALFGCDDATRFAILDKAGVLHQVSPVDTNAAIFTDSRVRQRELQVTAKLNDKQLLDIIHVQSIRDGKLYDIYYFCEICNIRAYAPGLCPCCRNELEFRETPN
jgi:hypothetical protein